MSNLIYILITVLIAYIIYRIVINSAGRIHYSPADTESINHIDQVKIRLKEKWDIDPGDFWLPLDFVTKDDTCYFEIHEIDKQFGLLTLSEIINSLENGNIFSFGETNEFKSLSRLSIDKYPGLDTYYTNEYADWVVYITHENTIAFGGVELINSLKKHWIDFDNYVNPYEK
jgi:hypothetical protein